MRSKMFAALTMLCLLTLATTACNGGLFGKAGGDASQGELAGVYRAYLKALEDRDLEAMKATLSEQARTGIERMESMEDMESREKMLGFLFKSGLKNVSYARQAVSGDHGVLRVEGFGAEVIRMEMSGDPPPGYERYEKAEIKSRFVVTILFQRVDGEWRMERQLHSSYLDPRPQFRRIEMNDAERILDSLKPQLGCGFEGGSAMCALNDSNANPAPDQCWSCFAELRADASLCDQVAKNLETQDAEFFKDNIIINRANCRSAVARLTHDPAVCAAIPEDLVMGQNFRERCLNWTELHDFIPGDNFMKWDSDGDGLTDKQETFFNTSITLADTDGDGISDGDEVRALTNPLGKGKLGDHLN